MSKNILKHVTTAGWEVTTGDTEVTCHSRMIGGVLCRWWGDGPTPDGVAIIDSAAPPAVWSRETPTVEGWYWWRYVFTIDEKPTEPRVVQVILGNKTLQAIDGPAFKSVEGMRGEWAGPLESPKE